MPAAPARHNERRAPLGGRRPKRSQGETSTLVWLWPAVAAAAAFLAAVLLVRVRPPRQSLVAQVAWPGDIEAAATMLQVVAGSVITATSLTFTMTVVALQLAAQQYSPRLLREFARDRVTQLVLAVLVAAFVYSVTVLRGLDGGSALPSFAVLGGFLLGLASVGALLAFIGHIARALRVDTMMVAVADETRRAMRMFYPPYDEQRPEEAPAPASWPTTTLAARRSGFVRSIGVGALVEAAVDADGYVEVAVRPGDHVVLGAPLARVVAADPGTAEALAEAVCTAVDLAYERTMEQDCSFGFRQLTDIAVKALSPGINDPVTAAHAVGHMADLVVRLTALRLGTTAHADDDGVPRVVVPDRDLRYYLDLCCGQIRRYGAHEPTVLVALLRLLRDVAAAARDDEQRAEVARQVDLILATASPDLVEDDACFVRDMAARVEAALRGAVVGAFEDRAGETRSI